MQSPPAGYVDCDDCSGILPGNPSLPAEALLKQRASTEPCLKSVVSMDATRATRKEIRKPDVGASEIRQCTRTETTGLSLSCSSLSTRPAGSTSPRLLHLPSHPPRDWIVHDSDSSQRAHILDPRGEDTPSRVHLVPQEDGASADPAVVAVKVAFRQQQQDLRRLFTSTISSLQCARGEHEQHLQVLLEQLIDVRGSATHGVHGGSPGKADQVAFQRLLTPASQFSQQSSLNELPNTKDLCFLNTTERALKKSLTSQTLLTIGGSKVSRSRCSLGWASRVTHSAWFSIVVAVVILMNSFLLGWQSQIQLDRSKDGTGMAWTASQLDTLLLLDLVLGVLFALEMVLRIAADGPLQFVKGREKMWNLFESALVLLTFIDMGVDVGRIFQTTRLIRLTKLLRVVRIVRHLPRTFTVMVSSIVASSSSLLWVFLVLSFLIYSFSLLLIQGVTVHFEQHLGDDAALDAQLARYYGSVADGILTLFATITGGNDWTDVLEPLWEVGAGYGYLFIFFVYFTIFGALNVVTSLFVDGVHKLTLRSREISVQNEKDMAQVQNERIKKFFREADINGSGFLSLDEFLASLQNEECAAYFSSLGLDVAQAREFYHLLDTGNRNEIGVDEFAAGCMKLKGGATSLDVNMLLVEQRNMMFNWSKFMDYVEYELETVKKHVKKSGGPGPSRKLSKVRNSARSSASSLSSEVDLRLRAPHDVTPELAVPRSVTCPVQVLEAH